MKILLSVISALLIIIPCCIGLNCRKSYTDVSENVNPFDSFEIGLLGEFSSQYLDDYFYNSLENESKYIIRVKSEGKINFWFNCYSETVTVLEVYKGDGITINENIEIARNSSTIFWNMNNTNSINTGFVNKMNKGEEYLVFLNSKLEIGKDIVYKTTPCTIAPIFSYEEHTNEIIDVNTDNSSVNYNQVNTNEFFVADSYSLNVLENAKTYFTKTYSND